MNKKILYLVPILIVIIVAGIYFVTSSNKSTEDNQEENEQLVLDVEITPETLNDIPRDLDSNWKIWLQPVNSDGYTGPDENGVYTFDNTNCSNPEYVNFEPCNYFEKSTFLYIADEERRESIMYSVFQTENKEKIDSFIELFKENDTEACTQNILYGLENSIVSIAGSEASASAINTLTDTLVDQGGFEIIQECFN